MKAYLARLQQGVSSMRFEFMKASNLAVCTLSVLMAGGVAAQATEAPPLDSMPVSSAPVAEANAPVPVATVPSIETNISSVEFASVPEFSAPVAQTSTIKEFVAQTTPGHASQLQAEVSPTLSTGETVAQTKPFCVAQRLEGTEVAQSSAASCLRPTAIEPIVLPDIEPEFGASPALSIYIPVGFGLDRNTAFISSTYQATVRNEPGSVASVGAGIGLGNADEAVGLELSYATETSEPFGDGGFNAKLHRRFRDLGVAVGWNGFANTSRHDFEHSKYLALTKVFRTRPSLDDAFSRMSVTVGVGDGQFRSNGAIAVGDNNINVFGNVAFRVFRPVSLIAEWTGTDLALGLSIAPFRRFPLVITPAVRDLAGRDGQAARFVLGAGMAFRF